MVELSDGRKVKIDLKQVTIREYRAMFGEGRSQEQEDAIVARCAGMTVDELTALNYVDYHLVGKAFFDAAKNPLADPN